jgi:two-component system copper resistance phosphate regulon response regulator CusR
VKAGFLGWVMDSWTDLLYVGAVMKLLLVEDEKKTSAFISKGLSENGFVVDVAENGEDGLHLALTGEYDLIILDVMLPKKDGWSVLSELRGAGKDTLAVFLTAKDETQYRVKGLDLGADAYLVKPFAFSELLALLRSLLRRRQKNQLSDVLVVGDLEIDPVRHRASRAKKRLDLTPKEFSLLHLLAARSGEVLSRALIAEQVWNMNFDCDTNVVDVHIRRLRSKLDDPYEQKLIHTIRGVGYVLRQD